MPDTEAAAQTVDDRDQRGDVGGVAGPHLAADRPPVLIHDNAYHHLRQVGPAHSR